MTEHLIILGRTDSISPGNSSNLVVFAFSADLFAESSKSFAVLIIITESSLLLLLSIIWAEQVDYLCRKISLICHQKVSTIILKYISLSGKENGPVFLHGVTYDIE